MIVNRQVSPAGNRGCDLPVPAVASAASLHAWLVENHAESSGIRVRIFRKNTGIPSVTFDEVPGEGLCFGWSESRREKFDGDSCHQKFTPRRTKGTASERNRQHASQLIREGRMTPAGLRAPGMGDDRPEE